MINKKINIFLFNCLKQNEMSLIDVYFGQLFKSSEKYSYVGVLFTSIVSLSNRLGHVCLPVCEILGKNIYNAYILSFLNYFFSILSIPKCINILFQLNIISSSYLKNKTPLILYKNCIYLYKFYIYEQNVVSYINKNIYKKYFFTKKNFLILNKYLNNFNFDVFQKFCIYLCLFNKFCVISGGPGTGKTTLISKLILILYKFLHLKSKDSICVVTPTGKSASYLTKYLNNFYNTLDINCSLREILPQQAYTIHKVLGFNFYNNTIKYNRDYQLNCDVFIIDECSMVDLTTFYYILSALNNKAKIILVGDHNQIGSIEAGSLFNEICGKSKICNFFKIIYNNQSKKNFAYISIIKILKNYNICFLKYNYRFLKKSFLFKLSSMINIGNVKKIDLFLKEHNFSNNLNFYDANKFNYDFVLKKCLKYYQRYILYVMNLKSDFSKIGDFYAKFQLICVLRDTMFGVNCFNRLIKSYFLKSNFIKIIHYYYFHSCYHFLGEPIIILKNNIDLNLFNGDLGFFVLDKEDKLKVLFPKSNLSNLFIHPNSLLYWENSWAITVHKSQGSEFNTVLLILPDIYVPILNSKLIYTAITRSKQKVIIYAKKEILLFTISKFNQYYSNITNNLNIVNNF